MAEILRLPSGGYVALYRAMFDHALFRGERPFTRLQAWAWLICDAAWKVEQRRVGGSTVTLERGQCAATVRSLAQTWGWSLGAVQRFLGTLKKHGMARTFVHSVASTETDTPTESKRRRAVTVITICNYTKFQRDALSPEPQPIQQPIRKPSRRGQQVLDLGDEFAAQEVNQTGRKTKQESVGEEERRLRKVWPKAPAHLQVSRKHGTIYIERGTPEWLQYAADYMEARGGVQPFPNAYKGAGRWFSYDGEAAAMQRAAERRRRRA